MNIANKPGVYKDFSGKIKWEWIACVVRNADFEIFERIVNRKEINFADVVFVSGVVRWCVIKNGLNLGCDFSYCNIDYMINKGGLIFDCNWRDGIFEGGEFQFGTWFDGIWISGKWHEGKNSKKEKMESTPDKW